MSALSTADNSDEQVVASFVAAYETAADKPAVLKDYCHQYPLLASEFESLVKLAGRMDEARPADPAPPRRLEAGRDLGPFRILRPIAAGGMGEVYEATQAPLDRHVAVKVIRRGWISPVARERFLREQHVLAKLHQTHIVPIHSAGEEGDLQYFAMQYIEGAALHHVVRTALARETSKAGGRTPSLSDLVGSLVGEPSVPPTRYPSTVSGPPGGSAATAPEPSADAAPATDPTVRLSLSAEYFRSAAEVMAQAAEALQHAHDAKPRGICHRDIKPSNLMVDRSGHCWIIDFGLAGYLDRPGEAIPTATGEGREAAGGVTRGPMGTPAYMAPEQYAKWYGVVDHRTDVWALGATLYELLTLRPAFDGNTQTELEHRICSEEPKPPRELVGNVPPDLSAICLRALNKDRYDRYPTAREFAADLRRWLRQEPTKARPAWPIRRFILWSRRNKGYSLAMLTFVFAAFALVIGAFHLQTVWAREDGFKTEQQRRSLMDKIRLTAHTNGWSQASLELACDAASIRADLDLRNQMAATLSGLDARIEKQFDKGASSVAFDATGERLLVGGVTGSGPEKPAEGAKVWDRKRHQIIHVSSQSHDGPVAFRADGTPLQLVPNSKDRHAVILWDVARNELVREFRIVPAEPVEPLRLDNVPDMFLSPDGTVVAATAPRPDETVAVALWDATSGEALYRAVEKVTSLTISPDRALLALGGPDGQITIRSLPKGEALVTLKADRMAITSLAFQRGRERTEERKEAPPSAHRGWLLAAGDRGGTVTVWDCESRLRRSVCRGTGYHVHAVAFSPDGMTLASTGNGRTKLWDIATGHPLLDLESRYGMTGIAFSHDGQRLATSGVIEHGSPGLVRIWHLERDRGIQTLRGLAAEVEKVEFSPNEQLLAALSRDCRVAVWDLKTGGLLHVFDAPITEWVDNAAFAISPDNRHLAFSGSTSTRGQAVVWNLATGANEGNWSFSPGLNNLLAFHATGKLLLFQVETKDGKHLPDSTVDRSVNPLVFRVRDLRSADPKKPLFEITEFNRKIDWPVISEDGNTLALVGYSGDDQPRSRRIKAFDGLTGK